MVSFFVLFFCLRKDRSFARACTEHSGVHTHVRTRYPIAPQCMPTCSTARTLQLSFCPWKRSPYRAFWACNVRSTAYADPKRIGVHAVHMCMYANDCECVRDCAPTIFDFQQTHFINGINKTASNNIWCYDVANVASDSAFPFKCAERIMWGGCVGSSSSGSFHLAVIRICIKSCDLPETTAEKQRCYQFFIQ